MTLRVSTRTCWSEPTTCQITFHTSTSRASISHMMTMIVTIMMTVAVKKTTVAELEMKTKMMMMMMTNMMTTVMKMRNTTDYRSLRSECTITPWSSISIAG